MALETFIALVLFAFTTSITPGPNNTMVLASGANFGFRSTLPHLLGIIIGFFVLLLAVGFGLGAIFTAIPTLFLVLKFAGGAYLLWIAWKIGSSRSLSDGVIGASPLTFLQAAAFQWVNPKAWVMTVTAMATYADTRSVLSVLAVSLLFILVGAPCTATWLAFGSVLRGWLSAPQRLKWFNITMAVLLVLSLWPLMR